MKTFTTYAEKKAKQFFNLLQGYTKGIRMTAILILLLMGVSNAWAVDHTGGYIYFLKPSTWTESKVMMFIGHNSYTSVYEMTKVSNTDNLYRYTMPSWGGATYVAFANDSYVWGTGDWGPSNRTNAKHYTNVYNNYGFNSGSYYVVVPASTSNNAGITINYKSSAANLNLTTKAIASNKAHGTVSVSGYYMSNATTASTRSAVSSTSSNATASTTLAPGSIATFKATASTGYEFVGWYDAATGGNQLSTSTTYTYKYDISYTGKTVYGRFKAKEYTITYKDKGDATFSGTHESGYPTTHTYGTATTLKTATKTGYTFDGWFTNSGCTGSAVTSLGATAYTANITLYAKWTANTNTAYTVEHYKQLLNGNYSATPDETENLTGTTDASVTPAVKSYTGFTAPSAQTVTIKADGSLVVTYKYTRNKHTLTWNLDGGDITGAGTAAGEVAYGATLTAPTVEKDGHTFTGWSPAVPATMPDNDVTCTAQWKKNMYTVTYGVVGAANGTIALNETPAIDGQETQKMEHGTTLTFTATPTTGYQIEGWYSDELGKISLGNGTATTYPINSLTSATTVFVKFEEIPASTYIVTFDANGGDNGTMNSQSFTENVPQNLTPNAFTRTGYAFSNWNTQADGTGDSYADGQSVTLTTAGLTLYAQWTANQYTITLDKQGGTGGTNTVTVHYDNNDYSANPVNIPSIQGYAFMGYYVAEKGSGFQVVDATGNWVKSAHGYTDASGNWTKASDITLYAHFEKAQVSITLNKEIFESGTTEYVVASHTIAPTPAGTTKVCWGLCYSNGSPVAGHEPIEDGDKIKFPLEGLSAGSYKVVATLYLGNECGGEELSKAEATFVVAGSYTVTIKYTCDGQEIAGRTTKEGHPSRLTAVTAAEIGGYNFVKWELGDGISTKDALTDQTINITASYKGYLTATYEKKKLIFLDLSTLKTKVNWTTPHIYLYKGAKNENTGGYWNDLTGAGGATGGNYITHAAMTKVPDTENIWYFDYEQYTNNFNVFVAFTSNNQGNVTHFADCEVIYRADFTSGTPVFVPASDQTAETKNSTAKYYSKGYWVRYMGGTGYWMIIYDAEGNKELVRREFTSETQRMTMTSIVDLEAKHTYKYEIYRNDGYYYNGGDITYTNSSNYKPLNEANKHSIKTTESGNYTFTLDYSAGDLQIKVQYPVEVGDYRILYKDNTRTTYKPSDIKKAEELNPVTSFFIRPKSNPELKIQTATYISDGDVSWSTTNADEIHFKPNANWKSDGARFAAYFYKGNTTKIWKDLTKNGDIYTCEKPSGCTHVIFCRMNPDVKTNSFEKGDGKPLWNQTRDLTLPTDGKNFYSLEEGAWRGQIYLKPNSNWTADGARFAAYFFEKSGGNTKEDWHSMFKEDDGTYWCDIPEGYSQVIFCRMNPNVQDNNWDASFWGMQTNDLLIPTNSNDLYTITNGQNKPTGAWSCKSWNEINTGSITDLTEKLKDKLGEINGDIGKAPDSVYTIHLSNNEGTLTIEKVAFYTGNFYIRVDAAAGRWYDYKTNPDNLMTYSAFSESDANSFGEKFSHYKTKWCPRGTNVKFVIANDYSPCISDTLARDLVKASGDDYMTEGGELYQEDGGTKDPVYDRYSANIRFMWHRKTNVISRAYLASSSNDSRQFLVLKGCQEIKDENGNNLSGNGDNHGEHCALLQDTQDWIYERTFMVQPGTRVKLYACYADATVSPATAQYFRGKHDDGNCGSAENSVQILGGNGTEWEKIRVIYDFKTNRLMGAWVPSGEISETQTIAADVMIMRNHQEDATCITLAEGKSLDSVKTVYGALRFNRWTLNNKDANSNSHQPLPLAQQQTIYERGLYFISFPFDVHLSDVFGLGTYGTHWVISTYNGKRRAERGYFEEDCINEDCTNWDYIWDPTDFVMKANEGYLLSLDLELMKDDDNSFWPHNINYRELFFPSQVELETITKTNYTMPELGSEYKCTINLNTDGTQHERDRRVKDSYWRCIGVPSFADYSGLLKDGSDESITWQPAGGNLPFLYDWNVTNNNLVVRSATNYRFRPTFAYLIQNGSEINWTLVSTKPNPIIARERSEATSNYEWKIALLRNDAPADHTFIRMTDNESVTSAFDFHQDLSKEFNYGANIYTLVGYERLAANSLPMSDSTTIIPLGVSAQEAGDYTITMPEGVESIGITLVDNETGIHTNLSAGQEYTLTLHSGICENRLFIEVSPIQNTPTDLEYTTEDTREQATRKMLIDGILYLIRDGVIYDAQGHRL